MIYDPRSRRQHPFFEHRYPERMRSFLHTHFAVQDGYDRLSDFCLDVAISFGAIHKGGAAAEDYVRVGFAVRKLLSCGFHRIGSFDREYPEWQVRYLIPFFRDFFDLPADATTETVFAKCHAEYQNLLAVESAANGDAARARDFFLKLHKETNFHEPIRKVHLTEA